MPYDDIFKITGMLTWIIIGITTAYLFLMILWEALGTTIFVYRIWRAANFAQMRQPFRTWLWHFGDAHTSVCFRNTGVVVRWPRPWYDEEADKKLSWNQIPWENEA